MITKQQRAKLTRATMHLANIGERYWKARVEDIPDSYQPCKRVINKYVDTLFANLADGVGLLLHGPKGAGKTHIACAVLKRALSYNARGLFLPVSQLQEVVIEKTVLESDEDEVPLWERARRVDLLVLDDLGEEHTRDFSNRVLENLCRYRNNRKRATLFTTNLKTSELGQNYGDWIDSVLKEMVLPLKVDGIDWRAENAAELLKRFQE